MKPTASSPDAAGVTGPDEAAELEAAVPADVSTKGLVVATPLNSWSWRATVDAPVVTVTLCTDAALGAYQSSPAELAPETKLVHDLGPGVLAVGHRGDGLAGPGERAR